MEAEGLKEARERFEALSKGRYYPGHLPLKEAKARLRACDPGLDIAPLLRADSAEELKRALLVMAAESADRETIAYFSPLLAEAAADLFALWERSRKGR
ncbi:hypothetical protein [Hydrogenimonas sp.]